MRSAVWLPLFDELADPRVVAGLAVEAEAAGWDGFFVWDQIAWRTPVTAVGDPQVSLAAAAAVTSRLVLGPMVSPLARRRPTKVARETVALDRLSGGRLVLGVGVGSDSFAGEYSRTGEPVEDRTRAEMLDESLEILRSAWTGEAVHHHGTHHLVDGMTFSPTPVRGDTPVWVAAFPGNLRPLRRAARHDGFFPVNLTSPDQLAEAVTRVGALRTDPDRSYDVAIDLAPETDPAPWVAAGATWVLTDVDPTTLRLDAVRGMVRAGPSS
ncbi:LLM class flavin-dependent oxidoreductase [Cellulomonas humilata]|uniref:LLM class flavin-dependent oxidoreductase n=1 Tax=Cellulomonas humilata TaxID=144055 RepID=A0A7Y6A171_9CELL|nr:LLM class flavin-dependent oxidoreductase [Cellulomonas humilata]NUU17891.1 LLM class flavin-dependent oxidoreductase [Cellulomonas humilata]